MKKKKNLTNQAKTSKALLITLLIASMTSIVTAQDYPCTAEQFDDISYDVFQWTNGIVIIAGLLATMMIVIQGLRWVISESPQERSEIKKSMLYVLLGCLTIVLTSQLVCTFFCYQLIAYAQPLPGANIECHFWGVQCISCVTLP